MAVTAVSHPQKIYRNNTAKPGEVLILTKALGTGVLTTALKNDQLDDETLQIITESMKRLNLSASEIMIKYNAGACTDVTGYGLTGHLYEMVADGHVSAKIYASKLPLLPRALWAAEKNIPGGLKENKAYLKPYFQSPENLPDNQLNIFFRSANIRWIAVYR